MNDWAWRTGAASAALLIAASMSMNGSYTFSQGRTVFEGVIFAAVSIGADGMKAILPLQMLTFWQAQKWGRLFGGTLLEALLLSGSLFAALGYAAENRDQVAETRDARRAEAEALRREITRLESDPLRLASIRPISVIDEDMKRERLDVLWRRSQQCEDATTAASRAFCQRYVALESERASAVEKATFGERLEALRADLAPRIANGAETGGRLMERLVARLTGLSAEAVHDVWLAGFAVLVELGSALGPLLMRSAPRSKDLAGTQGGGLGGPRQTARWVSSPYRRAGPLIPLLATVAGGAGEENALRRATDISN